MALISTMKLLSNDTLLTANKNSGAKYPKCENTYKPVLQLQNAYHTQGTVQDRQDMRSKWPIKNGISPNIMLVVLFYFRCILEFEPSFPIRSLDIHPT